MRNIIFLLSVTFFISCQALAFQKDYDKDHLILNEKIFIDGEKRNYHIYVPDNHENRPLVILLHGNRGSSNQVLGRSIISSPQKIWLRLAEENNFIVVAPNGSKGPEKHRGWNDCRTDAVGNPSTNDVLFISELLKKIETQYNHDPQRVFVAGVSNGGIMANRLAMEIPEKITAFASIVSSMPINSACADAETPISALFMNGTEDPLLPYDGGHIKSERGEVKATDACINYWTARNGTETEPEETNIEDINKTDGSTATKYHYKNGTNNTEVVLYKISNGGHTEPSLEEHYRFLYKRIVGNQNKDFEMAVAIWDFFKDKSNEY